MVRSCPCVCFLQPNEVQCYPHVAYNNFEHNGQSRASSTVFKFIPFKIFQHGRHWLGLSVETCRWNIDIWSKLFAFIPCILSMFCACAGGDTRFHEAPTFLWFLPICTLRTHIRLLYALDYTLRTCYTILDDKHTRYLPGYLNLIVWNSLGKATLDSIWCRWNPIIHYVRPSLSVNAKPCHKHL